jgi:hypothetical protein
MQKKTQKAHKKISEWYCSSLRGPQHDHSSNIFRSQLPSPPENRSSNQHGTRTAKPRLGFKRRRAMAEGPSFSDGENLKIHASAQVCGCVFLEPFEDVSSRWRGHGPCFVAVIVLGGWWQQIKTEAHAYAGSR